MIDFGLSKRYTCPKSGNHIKMKQKTGIMGTPRYCSKNAHSFWEQSRRDDLESIGNLLIYFSKSGWLPWIGSEIDEDEHEDINADDIQNHIREIYTPERLCEGLPSCFLKYWKYVRNLEFADAPDYNYLIDLFADEFQKQGFNPDFKLDWQIKREEIIQKKIE